MGWSRRHFLLSTCFLQMITIIERQVFDFLGYMWTPILVNFLHILLIIFGFYGAYHFRIKYIVTYLIWNFVWIGWNAFLICFYLNVGILNRQDSDLLNMGTGSVSWFEVNGYGCKPTYSANITTDDPFRPIRPERVEDCFLDYTQVEIIHSGVQCVLALFGILGAILISCIFFDEDDRFDFMNGDAKSPQHTVVHPMYVSYTSIPTSASATMQSNKHLQHQQQQNSLQFYHQHQHINSKNNNNSNNNTLNTVHQPDANANNHNAYLTPTSGKSECNSNTNSLKRLKIQSRSKSGGGSSNDTSTNSQRRTRLYQPKAAVSPISPQSNSNTTPSLSYASLQNSNLYLASVGGGGGGGADVCSSLNNSNYSIFNGNHSGDTNSSGHFARIHHKPKPPKCSMSGSNFGRADVKYTQLQIERLSRNLEEDEDNFSLQHLAPSDNGVTYVPFQSPTPNSLFVSENNNAPHIIFNACQHTAAPLSHSPSSSPNNNSSSSRPVYHYEQNGLPTLSAVRSPKPRRAHKLPTRPTNIPLPMVPIHSCEQRVGVLSPSAVTPPPPPPPAPRPHIFQQRLGHAPYPDLSPEITEKYAMPTQYVPSSPMVKRIQRRQRQQPAQANFCDQIRDAPPGYIDLGGHNIVRAKSDDRLVEPQPMAGNEAPHVNRRSGRREGKTRPRSYCNSIVGVQA